jgi:hypothetical protein
MLRVIRNIFALRLNPKIKKTQVCHTPEPLDQTQLNCAAVKPGSDTSTSSDSYEYQPFGLDDYLS